LKTKIFSSTLKNAPAFYYADVVHICYFESYRIGSRDQKRQKIGRKNAAAKPGMKRLWQQKNAFRDNRLKIPLNELMYQQPNKACTFRNFPGILQPVMNFLYLDWSTSLTSLDLDMR
jgi:hypothetical protein